MIMSKIKLEFAIFITLFIYVIAIFSLVMFECFKASGVIFTNSFTETIILIFECSLGRFDFGIFDDVEDENRRFLGIIMLIVITVTFCLLMMPSLISILANAYEVYSKDGQVMYLMMILSLRESQGNDPHYGAFIFSMSPLNLLSLPFQLALFIARIIPGSIE